MAAEAAPGSNVAHEGNSKQHARSSRPAAETTAGEAMELDGLPTAAGAAASPGATKHGPAAEALLKGAEFDVETEDMAGSSEAAAGAGMRPPRPVDRAAAGAAGAAGAAKDWQMGNAGAEAMAVAGGAAEAEAESVTEGALSGKRPKLANWESMTKAQRESWRKNAIRKVKRKGGGRTGT